MLNKLSLISFLVVTILVGYSFGQEKKANSFVGVEACGMCHKTDKQGKQLDIWKNSKHSKAFKTLQTGKADSIAAKLGHKTSAAQTEACLKCHTSGSNVDKALLGEKFKIEDGVQCETCHNAGSEYKKLQTMKDHAKSVAAGVADFSAEGAIEKLCIECHNEKSPNYKGFDFAARWAEIEHNCPDKK